MESKRYLQNPDIVTRKILDEVILVPIRGNLADMTEVFTLNDVGEFIWERLTPAGTMDEMIEEIRAHFDVDKETAHRDLVEFIHMLKEEHLIREVA